MSSPQKMKRTDMTAGNRPGQEPPPGPVEPPSPLPGDMIPLPPKEEPPKPKPALPIKDPLPPGPVKR